MLSRVYKYINSRIKTWYYSRKDYKTKRRFLVIESDDWGSIRMSSIQAWEELLAKGYSVDKRPYERFDILESDEDVQNLARVLMKYCDYKGHHPIITLNYLSSNPNFERISQDGMVNYYSELIGDTYNRYPNSSGVIDLIKQGINDGIFMPQCHGREHFNVLSWMKSLKEGDEDTHRAFGYRMCGIAPKNNPSLGNHFMVALESRSNEEQDYVCKTVSEGLELFERIWGFKSQSFVAPCYTWNSRIERVLAKKGVKIIQTSRIQHFSDTNKKRYHYLGEENSFKQHYTIRNCTFEPSTINSDGNIDNVMRQIIDAFTNNHIAIISSHRINYVSGLSVKNRDNNLGLLDELLGRIITYFPNVEFVSTPKLEELF